MSTTQIKRIGFRNVSGFLLAGEKGLVLIDTGYPSTTESFIRTLNSLGRSPDDLKIIILTHVHFDHVGGAGILRELTGAPVAVHRSEAGLLMKGTAPFPRGTRWKGKLLRFAGRVFAPHLANFPPLKADVLIDDEFDLSTYGIQGKVMHTPGHTLGSLTVILESGEAFVGDNAFGVSEKKHFPPFANDTKQVIRSWENYIAWNVKKIYPAHGRSFSIEVIKEELPISREKY